MKYLLLLLSLTAFAREHVSITSYGNTYFACSLAEDLAATHLETFGAKNIDVYCRGGISPWGGMSGPVSVYASFDLPLTTQVVEQIEIEGEYCSLNAQMINAFVRVMPNVQIIRKSDACPFTHSKYYFLLNITR